MSNSLVKYDAACSALAECKAIDEVKSWADKAAAMQAYGRMAKDKTLEIDAAEIRIRAERRLGEMLTEQKSEGGLNKGHLKQGPALVANEDGKNPPKLSDAGISYDLSSRAQKLAAVPKDEFEAEVGEWRERVTSENARVTARLELAGERAQGNARPSAPPEPKSDTSEIEALREQLAELVSNLASANEDNESMAIVFESDDRVAAAMSEAKKFREQNRVLQERIRGLMNELNEAKRFAKSWKAKFEKLERETRSVDPAVGF